jgi:outer membrane protein TolC
MNRAIALLISILFVWVAGLSCNIVFAAEPSTDLNQSKTVQSDSESLSPDVIDANDPLASSEPFTEPKLLSQNEIAIKHPALKALISFDTQLDPYALDAESTRPVALREVLQLVADRNLDIGISKLSEGINKYNYYGSLGKFLPDATLGYNYQYLKGSLNTPLDGSAGPMSVNGPFTIASAGLKYYVYRGGSTYFGALQNRNLYRAASHAKKATISNALLDATKLYYDLVLNEAILQIRIRAVEVSQAQVKLNKDLWDTGTANRLDVFQAETQLSQDRQNLIDQQIARRKSAIELSELLNLDQSFDLVPEEPVLTTKRLIDEHVRATNLIGLAIAHRPELKEVEQQRLAARKGIVLAASPLQPTVALTGTAYGIGEKQLNSLNSLGVNINWTLGGMGTTALASVQAARLGARQAQLRANEETNQVFRQVRESYLNALSAQQKILEAANQVRSATEEIRLARLRFENGLGKNIDVLRAQQDYTSSLIEKARAITNFNIAQVQLLRDIGLISVDSLTESVAAVPNSRG